MVEDPDGRKVELRQSEQLGAGWLEGDWTRFRATLLIPAAISGGLACLACQSRPMEEMPPFDVYLFVFGMLISIVLWPFMVVAVVGFQVINPYTDPVWKRPTHSSNPFRLRNPLYAAHISNVLYDGAGGRYAGNVPHRRLAATADGNCDNHWRPDRSVGTGTGNQMVSEEDGTEKNCSLIRGI